MTYWSDHWHDVTGREAESWSLWLYHNHCWPGVIYLRSKAVRFYFCWGTSLTLNRSLTTYAIVAAFFGGLCYLAYLTYFPQTKNSRSKRTPAVPVSSTSSAVTSTGTGGYEEEWIPEHHLRKSKSSKKQAGAASGTSADELSPAETSGTEGKRRKGKKWGLWVADRPKKKRQKKTSDCTCFVNLL